MKGSLTKKTGISTLLEAICISLGKSIRCGPGEVPPAAVLWTDPDGQWASIIPQLKSQLPGLLSLGHYDPKDRQGPAIWIRCVIERTLSEVSLPIGTVPVIYMPNVSRQLLRSEEECSWELQPLVELQYQGMVWSQRNGRDWTLEAFLVSEEAGLRLEVARDNETRRAMLRALPNLAATPVNHLRGKRLEAEDFDRLMIEDTQRELLSWLDSPAAIRGQWDESRWSAFCSRCQSEYGFDPATEGELVAGERLGHRQDTCWMSLWNRFAEAPGLYLNIPDLLRRSKPDLDLFSSRETWPDENENEERILREALRKLLDTPAGETRHAVEELERQHGARRAWVWARLGLSPLAETLEHLAALAGFTSAFLGGGSLRAMADLYTQEGYLADEAAWLALVCARSDDDAAVVAGVVRTLYLPWLEAAAEHFQNLADSECFSVENLTEQAAIAANPGRCLLFVDGLRFDLGRRLLQMAEKQGFSGTLSWRWAAVPTVTATSKPAVAPIAAELTGHELGDDFRPRVKDSGQSLTSDHLRRLLNSAGYQILASSETGQPGPEAKAWTEYGDFDSLGHKLQVKVALQLDTQLELLLERLRTLLEAGWRQVRVITDHGWLLLPGGFPTIGLPKHLTETRWSRCAVIKRGAKANVPVAFWSWNPIETFAYSSGVRCFIKGYEYVHGGMSLQECVLPDIVFAENKTPSMTKVGIVSIQWVGMRCRVVVESVGLTLMVDIRQKVTVPASSIAKVKPVGTDGNVAVLVEDDSLIGMAVNVVLLDCSGQVVAKKGTTVGGED